MWTAWHGGLATLVTNLELHAWPPHFSICKMGSELNSKYLLSTYCVQDPGPLLNREVNEAWPLPSEGTASQRP